MDYSWKVDNFDWGVFGFKVAKITNVGGSGSSKVLDRRVKKLIKELITSEVEYASYRVQANNVPVIHALERSGFILVDGLISLSIDTSSITPEVAPEIREAHKNDLAQLRKLTSGLYSFSRIDNDPLIPKDPASKFYVKWIENSVLGKVADSVLVWLEHGKIAGYITLQKKGQIPLIGVSKKFQGKGIAKKLLSASFRRFKEWGVREVIIETQMDNIPALRAYQSVGFKISDSHLTFRWSSL
jgi:dTDP-4-amino-4,6-dideoxy-D-galactose acyltransferase